MDVVDDAVELFKELLLLLLEVLELLVAHLVLPLDGLVILLGLHDFPLLACEFFTDLVVFNLQLLQASDLLPDVLKRLNDHVVGGVLEGLLAVGGGLSAALDLEVGTEGADHIHIQARDVVVVVMDVLVLLLVLGLQLFYGLVLLCFYLSDLGFALGFHVLSQAGHLGLILLLDFAGDTLVLLSLSSG